MIALASGIKTRIRSSQEAKGNHLFARDRPTPWRGGPKRRRPLARYTMRKMCLKERKLECESWRNVSGNIRVFFFGKVVALWIIEK